MIYPNEARHYLKFTNCKLKFVKTIDLTVENEYGKSVHRVAIEYDVAELSKPDLSEYELSAPDET